MELMKENLGAELCGGDLPAGDKVVLFPVYPFLKKEELNAFLEKRSGSFSFAGGYVVRGGEGEYIDERAGLGLFSLADLPAVLNAAERESALRHSANGALVENGAAVDFCAELESGVVVKSGARVLGNSKIGENAVIGSGSEICGSEVGAGTKIMNSVLSGVKVGENCTVGPFAYLRPGSVVDDGCRIGDFVEIKNSHVGAGSKASHLVYIGDADVGERVNIGCGVVFVNYNGKRKSKTVIGDGSFIGSNCNLIAPVNVGKGVYLAAGTTLTHDLEKGDFCIGRSRESVKSGRAPAYLKKE